MWSVVDAGLDLVHLLGGVVGHDVDGLHIGLLLAVEQLHILVVALDCALNVLTRSENDGSVHARAHLDILDDGHVVGVGDGNQNLVVVNVQRHDAVAAGERLGHELQHLGALDDELFFHKSDIEPLRVSREQLCLVDDAARQKNVADILVGVTPLPAYSIAQLIIGDDLICEQNFPNQMIVQAMPSLVLMIL